MCESIFYRKPHVYETFIIASVVSLWLTSMLSDFSDSYLPTDLSLTATPAPPSMLLGAGDAHVDDMLAVKQHIHKLSRRVLQLEQIHDRNALKEKIFYPAVTLYLVYQFMKWVTKV